MTTYEELQEKRRLRALRLTEQLQVATQELIDALIADDPDVDELSDVMYGLASSVNSTTTKMEFARLDEED